MTARKVDQAVAFVLSAILCAYLCSLIVEALKVLVL